jgi:hypothetical protein
MYCQNCGAENEAGARFCVECGTPLESEAVASPPPLVEEDADRTILTSAPRVAEEAKTVSVTQAEVTAAKSDPDVVVESPTYTEPKSGLPPPPIVTSPYITSTAGGSPDSTDTIAMVIEIVFGVFGLMGMGWLYVGNFLYAALIFIGFVILLTIEVVLITLTAGFCACVAFPLNLVIVIVSGLRVRDYVQRTGAKGSVLYVVIAAVVGFLLLCGLGTLLFLILGAVGSLSPMLEDLMRELSLLVSSQPFV